MSVQREFLDADATKDPQLNLGKRFASPKKRWTSRAKRAEKRTWLISSRSSVTQDPVSLDAESMCKVEIFCSALLLVRSLV